jgi:hypothetical protein
MVKRRLRKLTALHQLIVHKPINVRVQIMTTMVEIQKLDNRMQVRAGNQLSINATVGVK